MKKKCPFCDKEIGSSGHIYKCKENNRDLSKDDIKFEFIKKNTEFNLDKDFIKKHYFDMEYSLVDFKEKFNLDYKTTIFLINYFGFKQRTISEGKKTKKAIEKTKLTNIDRYGCINPSKNDEIKNKKKETFLLHYGVDNIFKSKDFIEWLPKYMVETYGKGSLSGSSEFMKNRWKNMSEDEKKELHNKKMEGFKKWYDNLSEEEKNKIIKNRLIKSTQTKLLNNSFASSLEKRLLNLFNEMNIEVKQQLFINRRSYDFLIKNTNKIIEVQGDFWHANPSIYKKNDILNLCSRGKLEAELIWNNDLEKKNLAESYGYNVYYIWESDMKNMTDNDLKIWILEVIENENKKYKENI